MTMAMNTYGDHLLTLQDGMRFVDVRKIALWAILPADFDVVGGGEYNVCAYQSVLAKGEPLVCATYADEAAARVALRSLNTALIDSDANGFNWGAN